MHHSRNIPTSVLVIPTHESYASMMILLGYLVIVATIGENLAFPSPLGIYRRSISVSDSSKKTVYQQAPNLDYQWVTHIKRAPEIVSFHSTIDSVPMSGPLASFAEFMLRGTVCPLIINLDKPDSDPSKNKTAVLFNDEDAKGITVVLTDNKSYFVGASNENDGNIVVINRLVNPLVPTEETKIKEKLKEIGYSYTPSTEIRKEQCKNH